MLKNILIRGVSVYDALEKKYSAAQDILITDGVVARMEPHIEAAPGTEIVEGENLRASVGWTDCHTHLDGFDPFLSYPALGATAIHDAGSYGAYNYAQIHDVIARMPFPVTTYLYVGCWGVTGNGHDELITLENLKPEPFYEVAKEYAGEIVGAKIRIDPRVNSDTKLTLRQAKDVAVHAGLPLIVHPSRTKDSLEEVLEVLERDDVYAHTYSPVAPSLFDENGRIKKCAWDAMKRGVRFDLSHGSNNFSYEIARKAIEQDFVVETISTDMHLKNYDRAGISLAGVMTKAVHAGISVEDALEKVILAPGKLLHTKEKPAAITVGMRADITVYTVSEQAEELPDSMGNAEVCRTQIRDVATIIGSALHRSIDKARTTDNYWPVIR